MTTPARETKREAADAEIISALSDTLTDAKFNYLAKGLRSGGFPIVNDKMISWSDWVAIQMLPTVKKLLDESSSR